MRHQTPDASNRLVAIRKLVALGLVSGVSFLISAIVFADTPTSSNPKGTSTEHAGEVELVESVIKARKDYWVALDKLRQHYVSTHEIEKTNAHQEQLTY